MLLQPDLGDGIPEYNIGLGPAGEAERARELLLTLLGSLGVPCFRKVVTDLCIEDRLTSSLSTPLTTVKS